MDGWLELAEGPLFRFGFLIMALGLLRLIVVSIGDVITMRRNTPDKEIQVSAMLGAAFRRLSPVRWLTARRRGAYTATSVLFHVGLILVPILYLPHVQLWEQGVGLSWWSLPHQAADGLTLLTVVTGVLLVAMRYADRGSRQMSKLQDWLLTPLCVLVFTTGFLAAHVGAVPVAYQSVRLVHVLAGDALLVALPFTKLAHVVLLPFTQVITELGWRFVPGVGARVRAAFGHQDRPI